MTTQKTGDLSIGEYLIRRLQDYGIRDVFGIPGDYMLSFYTMLEAKPAAYDRLHTRRLRRFRRRCLCARKWDGRAVRNVLRWRLERVQLDRGGLRREVARRA